MKVLWVNPSFLDYRVPVYAALNERLRGGLCVVYSKDRTPERVVRKIESAIGGNAVGLTGEHRFEFGRRQPWANSFLRVPYQPGLMRTLMSIEADAVIAEGFFQWAPAALIKSVVQKLPFVVAYERTHHTERNCPRWRTAYRRRIVRMTDAMLCSGTECSLYSQSLGMPAGRIVCGHMCAETDGIARRARAISDERRGDIRALLGIEGVAFLFAGRLIELKGLRQLLECWLRFEQAWPGAGTLLLAGDGPMRPELECLVARARNVRLLGHIDYDELAAYYAAADVFVFPTLEDNGALVVPEAMACGLPILCSKYNGMHDELIEDGVNGWVFDPLNADDFYDRLRVCAAHASRLADMGQRSQEIIQDYTPARAAESVVEGCLIAIEHRRGRRPTIDYSIRRPIERV
ncbi:glycosyltransferase family 4 protein [bacterium]|nr:glycosyltransferase family 4 protein [bacterium]